MAQYFIPAHKFESFNREVKRVAKKCRKAGVEYTYEVGDVTTIEVVVHENFTSDRKNLKYTTMMDVYPIELNIKLKHNGWNALGVVVDADGIKQAHFGNNTKLSKEYLHVDMCRCDHCHTRRVRKSVCVLEHEDGRRMVIGTTCVKEFTDGLDGSLCKEILEFFNDKYHMNINVDDRRYYCSMDEFENYFGGVGSVRDGASRYYITKEFVSYAAALIDKYGYVSKSMAEYCCGAVTPTVFLINDFIDNVRYGNECVLEKHEDIAEKAIEWCKNLNDDEIQSPYLLNLREICRDDFCTSRHWGMLVSLVPTYKRESEKREAAKKTVPSEYVSEVGTRTTFDVKLLADITFEDFNCYARGIITKHIIKMDCDGNVLVWITEKHPHKEIGDTFKITGTVKKHSEYKGVKQTVLTRCKIA